jgi:hypothetical protein
MTESVLIQSITNGLLQDGQPYADFTTGAIFELSFSQEGFSRHAHLKVRRTREGDYAGDFRTYKCTIATPRSPVRSTHQAVLEMVQEAFQNFDFEVDHLAA